MLMEIKVVHQHQRTAIELSIGLQLFKLPLATRLGDPGIRNAAGRPNLFRGRSIGRFELETSCIYSPGAVQTETA
jgi:hypothetical protein